MYSAWTIAWFVSLDSDVPTNLIGGGGDSDADTVLALIVGDPESTSHDDASGSAEASDNIGAEFEHVMLEVEVYVDVDVEVAVTVEVEVEIEVHPSGLLLEPLRNDSSVSHRMHCNQWPLFCICGCVCNLQRTFNAMHAYSRAYEGCIVVC